MNHFGMTGLDDYDDDDDWWLWWLLLCWWLWRQTKEKQKKAIEYVRWKNNFWNTWSDQIIQIRYDFISFHFVFSPFPLSPSTSDDDDNNDWDVCLSNRFDGYVSCHVSHKMKWFFFCSEIFQLIK